MGGGEEDVTKWHDAMDSDDIAKNAGKLLDKEATPTVKEFKKYFDKFVTVEDKKIQINLQPNLLLQVAQRCVESHFWKHLLVLIDSECVSLSMVPNLLEKAMEENLLEVIVSCVRHQRDISDQDVVKLIKYMLHTNSKLLIKTAAKILSVDASTIDDKRALHLFLDTIFSFKRENLFIYNSLKALTLEEIKEILEYLYEWINAYAEICDVSVSPQALGVRIVVLPYKSVLNWMAMLIDTHYAQLIFSKDLHTVINAINRRIGGEAYLCHRLSNLDGYVAQFESTQKLNQIIADKKNRRGSLSTTLTPTGNNQQKIGLYSIEYLIV